MQFFVDIFPLRFGTVDPHIFTVPDPNPGSQNLADPTNPDLDPKHWTIFPRKQSVSYIFNRKKWS